MTDCETSEETEFTKAFDNKWVKTIDCRLSWRGLPISHKSADKNRLRRVEGMQISSQRQTWEKGRGGARTERELKDPGNTVGDLNAATV